jgi:hypothetical protein
MSPCDWSILTLILGISLINWLCRAKIDGTVREFKFVSNLVSVIAPLFLFLGFYLLLRSHFVGHEKIGVILIFMALPLLRMLIILKNLDNKK